MVGADGFLDRCVVEHHRQVRPHREADRPRAVVGCNGKRVGLGDDRDLARLAQTSAPARVEHDDPCGAVLAQAPEVRKAGHGLPHGQGRRRASRQLREADVVGWSGSVPAWLERIARRRDALRRLWLQGHAT
jgi:hypothetical protein